MGTAFSITLIFAGSFLWMIKNQKIERIIEENFNKSFQMSNTSILNQSFSFKDFSWHWEVSSQLKSLDAFPIELKNFKIQATRPVWGSLFVEKAVLSVKSRAANIKFDGALEISQQKGIWILNITQLDVAIGAFKKPIGNFALVELVSKPKGFEGLLKLENINLTVSAQMENNSRWIFQIPKQQVKTEKAKLPFEFFANLATTGDWTLSSRTTVDSLGATGATSIATKGALVNMSGFSADIFQNARGVAVVSIDLQSTETGLFGDYNIDLTRAAMDMNDRRFFKRENENFTIIGSAENDKLKGSVKIGNGKTISDISFEVSNKDKNLLRSISASFENLPLELIPRVKGMGALKHGSVDGAFEGEFTENSLGNHALGDWKFSGNDFKATWENPEILGLKGIDGDSAFEGRIELSSHNQQINEVFLNGSIDLLSSKLNLSGVVAKERNDPFVLQLALHKQNSKWLQFEGTATSSSNVFKFKMKNEKLLTVSFPQIYKTHNGSFTGTAEVGLCTDGICKGDVKSYNLNLADWSYEVGPQTTLKVSGGIASEFVKGHVVKTYNNLRIGGESEQSLKIQGQVPEEGTADIFLSGQAKWGQALTLDPGYIIKVLKLQDALIKAKFNISDEVKSWNLSFNGILKDKKLKLSNWQISSDGIKTYGQAEVSFEDYLLRNEKISITSTADLSATLGKQFPLGMQATLEGDFALATKGNNLGEWIASAKARINGVLDVKSSSIPKLFGEAFKAFSSESKNTYSRNLQECLPQTLMGRIDLDINGRQWTLSPSLFRGQDKESMLKFEGDLSDFNKIELDASYLPGPKCSEVLSSCLGDAFPKGGIPLHVVGSFKDPEADLDFKFMNSALEKCTQSNEVRSIAALPQIKPSEQRVRIKSLKDFYRSKSVAR